MCSLTYEEAAHAEGEVPLRGQIVQPASEWRPQQVGEALAGQQQPVGGGELVDGDQVHEDGRGEAVVGGDAEPVHGGEGEHQGVGGGEGDEGGDEAAHQHAGRVQRRAGHPGLVAQPAHHHLAHRVQNTCPVQPARYLSTQLLTTYQ